MVCYCRPSAARFSYDFNASSRLRRPLKQSIVRSFVSGHDFSRAERDQELDRASAPVTLRRDPRSRSTAYSTVRTQSHSSRSRRTYSSVCSSAQTSRPVPISANNGSSHVPPLSGPPLFAPSNIAICPRSYSVFGGSHNSIRLPSGSVIHPNLP